jgi:soluble lytic murein transglycosylase
MDRVGVAQSLPHLATLAYGKLIVLSLVFGIGLPVAVSASTSVVPMPRPSPSSSPAAANPTPPIGPAATSFLSTADTSALTDALNEADRKNWTQAMLHQTRISNPSAAKFIDWYRLTSKDSGAPLAEILAFQEQNPTWPRMALLKRRAEEAVLAYPMSSQDLLTWFSTNPPQSGEGKIRYGKTLLASGQTEAGKRWIEKAWAEDDFSSKRQREIITSYGKHISSSSHKARLDRLLWDRQTADARYTASLIGTSAKALAEARIRLMARSSAASDAVSRVPSTLQGDAGLLFDRIRYERKKGNDSATVPLLLTAPGKPHQMVNPDAWWLERRIAARVALNSGQYQEAYTIVSHHGLTDGSDFADAEFMAGWIALQYLNKPDQAHTHFMKLKNAVSTPISSARADYWLARSASAKGDKQNAEVYYRLASNNPTTFYGQLGTSALSHLQGHEARLHLPSDPKPTADQKASFKKNELVQIAQILNALDRETQKWAFMLHLADTLQSPQELVQLADLALTFNDRKLSLRIAKVASQRNILLPQRAYPTTYMPNYASKGPPVERALVFGLSRQESEFDPSARSPVGARGLMQLMPNTAKMVARQIDVPYSTSKLTSDPAYNAMLGSAHLGDLIQGYSGSYIMSVAAYNAGGNRVSEWRSKFGDPRSTSIDPIDWIESIPFSETRNYVQRVMENTEVYRTLLSGNAQKIRLAEDIRRNTGQPINSPAPVLFKTPMTPPSPATITSVNKIEAAANQLNDDETSPLPVSPMKRKLSKP